MKGGGLSGDLYRFVRVSGRLARFERNRENSIYPLIFRVFLHWGHVAEWLRSGLQNRLRRFNSGRGLHLLHVLSKTGSRGHGPLGVFLIGLPTGELLLCSMSCAAMREVTVLSLEYQCI